MFVFCLKIGKIKSPNFIFYHKKKIGNHYSRTEVSNTRPAGRMWLAWCDFAARVIIDNQMKVPFYYTIYLLRPAETFCSICTARGFNFFKILPSYRFEFETPALRPLGGFPVKMHCFKQNIWDSLFMIIHFFQFFITVCLLGSSNFPWKHFIITSKYLFPETN